MLDDHFIDLRALTYKFHDTVLEQFQFDSKRARLRLIIRDKHLDSNETAWVHLTISGIFNIKELIQAQEEITSTLIKEKRVSLNYRIDQLSFYKSTNEEVYRLRIQLSVDHLTPLIIKCMKATACIEKQLKAV